MNKRYIIIIAVLGVVLTIGIVFFTFSKPNSASSSYDFDSSDAISVTDKTDNDTYTTANPSDAPAAVPTPAADPDAPFVPATEMDLDPSSITVFVNQEHTLPKDYVPKNLVTVNVYFHLTTYDDRTLMRPEAAEALENLFAAAKDSGYELSGVSGYRSYSRQYQIFTNNILTKGKAHTLKYSAVPGASEHQTGLAIDISCKSLHYDLSESFSETPEGIWVAENAYKYGYIIRYPKDKADITGYAYEPWHIRYVGKRLAKYLYENDLTLEEYYHYTPSKDFDFEKVYAYLINITPSPAPRISVTPSITPEPTGAADGIIIDENGEIIDDEPDSEPDPTAAPEITDSPSISLTPVPEDGQNEVTVTPAVTEIPADDDNTPTGDDSQTADITDSPEGRSHDDPDTQSGID